MRYWRSGGFPWTSIAPEYSSMFNHAGAALKIALAWPMHYAIPVIGERCVPETPDWKQKYRDSALEMEAEEKRWQQIEKVLRRLINRLCAAGMGVNERLDTELADVAAANRRNADVEELEALVGALTTVVTEVDQVAPVLPKPLPAQRWHAACAAAGALLAKLAMTDTAIDAKAVALHAELARAKTDAELASILTRAADLVQSRNEMAEGERQQAATVLSAVNQRLEELVGYFASAASSNRAGHEDTAQFDARVTAQVRELTEGSIQATDLPSLQALVTQGLESVGQSVKEFREREEKRLLEQKAQAEEMRNRVVSLEGETRVLNRKLAQERTRARIDPLTNICNRTAFDERLTAEIARLASSSDPVTLLVMDIDDFKTINDTYGHRAGDRVLQTVAKSFAQGIRSTDFVARIGGEEFIIVMVGLPLDVATGIANELRTLIQNLQLHFRGTPVRVTVSCGITQLLDGDSPDGAFARADAALYRAKNGGKNVCLTG